MLDFPDSNELGFYLSSQGHSMATLSAAKEKWSTNDLRMEIPSFWVLFAEHATAPFFVFQVFLMWMTDCE